MTECECDTSCVLYRVCEDKENPNCSIYQNKIKSREINDLTERLK